MSVKQRERIAQACNFLHLEAELDDETVVINTASRELFIYGSFETVLFQLEGAMAWKKLSEVRQSQKENIESRIDILDLIVEFESDGLCSIRRGIYPHEFDLLVDGTLEQAQIVLGTLETERNIT